MTCYLGIVMKNREQLHTGSKPAPGDLAFLQALINSFEYEDGSEAFADAAALKAWLVRHGFLAESARITESDRRRVIAFREDLRNLIAARDGLTDGEEPSQALSRLAAQCRLRLTFNADGTARLEPVGQGLMSALGQILIIAAEAMLAGTWSRLKVCNVDRCRWVYWDGSKNRSGRWCNMSVCGSREKARAYRRRRGTR